MNFSEFQQKVRQVLAVDLPSGKSVVKQARSMAADINIGRTAFMEKMGVDSELAYKKQCLQDKRIMFHAHIGMSSWESTAEALTFIYKTAEQFEIIIDRAGICLDRRMGLPASHRQKIPAETGPLLETDRHWAQIGQVVPIQPHMGDFMIGFPASTANTINALKAGVTTIGNLSQFFAHAAPMWKNPVATAGETVRAMAIMGALGDKGTIVHSYLEDGFGALFCDCATVAGWACLERYIVEGLLGARLAHCIGGLTTDPDQIISNALSCGAEAILISTHNGLALDYARCLKEEMSSQRVNIPVVLGGILNQKYENQALPVDVSADLKELGFHPCPKLEGNFRNLLEANIDNEQIPPDPPLPKGVPDRLDFLCKKRRP